uniref:Uncharacterized protein n=1 Tax=Cannabis sativa TaxID=3483 RepID=A0A803QF85_CANSA
MATKPIGETSATPVTSRPAASITSVQSGAEVMGANRGVMDGGDKIMGNQGDMDGEGMKGDINGKSTMGDYEGKEDDKQLVIEQKRRRVTMGINGELPQEDMVMGDDVYAAYFDDHVMNNSNVSLLQKNLSGAGSG